MFLLPEKLEPLSVLLPASDSEAQPIPPGLRSNITHSTSTEAASTAALASAAPQLLAANAEAFLRDRGWSNLVEVVVDCDALWKSAAEHGALELATPHESVLHTRWLFAPSPALAQAITSVEAALLSEATSSKPTTPALPNCSMQPAQPEQHTHNDSAVGHKAEPEAALTFSCLDLGCGSCRDLAWLCSRHLHRASTATTPTAGPAPAAAPRQPQSAPPPGHSPAAAGVTLPEAPVAPAAAGAMPSARWEVTGVDNWLGALGRAHDMLVGSHLPADCYHLVLAEVCQETGALKPLEPGPRASQALRCHLAASAAAHVPTATAGPMYDLVLLVRFLARSFLPHVAQLLRPGGFVLVSTFTDCERVRAMGRPSDPQHVLQEGELAREWFGPRQGFEVLRDDRFAIPDGRLLCKFLAQKVLMQRPLPSNGGVSAE